MDDTNATARHALTAKATLDLVTTRTLIEALALIGIEWSPVSFNQMMRTSGEGLYTWVIDRGNERIDPLDRPVIYIGIGTSKSGGLYGRLRIESDLIYESAANAHGRAMFRLQGSAHGGPVGQIAGADISSIEETIRSSRFKGREPAIQQLRAWLAASSPTVVQKAERLCIRAAIHIGDTPPPVNSQFAGAWGNYEPEDWGGWAVAQRLADSRSDQ